MSRFISNRASKSSLGRMKSTGTGSSKKSKNGNSSSKRLTSKSGKMTIAFTKVYEGMTEQDLELVESYAKRLIANYHNMSYKYLTLKEYNDNFGTMNLTSNYYVQVGKINLGKTSIRVQRTFSDIRMIITYKVKEGIKF